MTSSSLAVILASVAMVIAGQLLLKRGMTLLGPVDAHAFLHPVRLAASVARRWQIAVGLGVYVAASLLWIYALSTTPLSVAYPFLGFSYAGVPLAAALVLRERPTPAQWLGMALVVAGVLVVVATG